MKNYEGVEITLHASLTSAIDGREWPALSFGCCTSRHTFDGRLSDEQRTNEEYLFSME
jgi:hypothetical protein